MSVHEECSLVADALLERDFAMSIGTLKEEMTQPYRPQQVTVAVAKNKQRLLCGTKHCKS